eukprot:TRINITY_DN3292_c0_g1_i2.p1 TRINITY_DN3292_c0_g1~~TRINITY_DN3292_c0_g1_i2.p1  ORF type:complete len:657 (-),score=164.37 TRINITY_DN3292_c0_g1_i2:60-2009(-)
MEAGRVASSGGSGGGGNAAQAEAAEGELLPPLVAAWTPAHVCAWASAQPGVGAHVGEALAQRQIGGVQLLALWHKYFRPAHDDAEREKRERRRTRGVEKCALRSAEEVDAFVASLRRLRAARMMQRCVRRHLVHKYLKKLAMRDSIAMEILETEKSYNEQLGIIADTLVKPLQLALSGNNALLTDEEIKGVFGEVAIIKALSDRLLAALQVRLDNWSQSQKLGDIFFGMSDYLRMYTDYVSNYENATTMVRGMEPTHHFWKFYATQIQKTNENYHNWALNSFLIVPIQRIPRYQLLLQTLVKVTIKSHPDYNDLFKACEKIGNLAMWVNDSQRKFQNNLKVLDLQKATAGLEEARVQFVAASREYITEGDVLEVSGKKIAKRFVILFNDLLVICEHKKSESGIFKRSQPVYKYAFVMCFNVADIAAADVPDSTMLLNAIELTYRGRRKYTMCTQTAEQKVTWLRTLKETINKEKESLRVHDDMTTAVAKVKAEQTAAILSQKYASLKNTYSTNSLTHSLDRSNTERSLRTTTVWKMNPAEKLSLYETAMADLEKMKNDTELAKRESQMLAGFKTRHGYIPAAELIGAAACEALRSSPQTPERRRNSVGATFVVPPATSPHHTKPVLKRTDTTPHSFTPPSPASPQAHAT